MARPCLDRNPKFKMLVLRVGSKALARGYLELIWDSANECGNPVFESREHILAVCETADEKVVDAIIGCGFLDHAVDGFEIHDFWDHAPDYVKKRQKRELSRHMTGQRLVSDQSVTGHRPKNIHTPAPAPAPAHSYSDNQFVLNGTNGSYTPEFEAFWKLYPNKRRGAKDTAFAKWKVALKQASVSEITAGLEEYIVSEKWTEQNGKFIDGVAKWLKGGCWKDHPPKKEHSAYGSGGDFELSF